MDNDKLREAAREEIEALPAETAAGGVDADSDGPETAFHDGEGRNTGDSEDG